MKKKSIFIVLLSIWSSFLIAQNEGNYKYKTSEIPLWQSGSFGNNAIDLIQFSIGNEAPVPGGDYSENKKIVNKQRQQYNQKLFKSESYKSNSDEIAPQTDTSFDGQPTGARGIPNDNHIAVSNEGKIVSVQNSSFRVMDENGKTLLFKSLYAFANGKIQGFTNYCYDPKVVYDHIYDRFILFFLHESKVVSNFGVLAFSKTNDPAGDWNFYKIPGNPLKNDKWSDYPIMAVSQEDVFITLNLLSENTDWREGFNQSIIWQISKREGFLGDTLINKLYFDIKFNSKAVWSICPVQGGFKFTHPNMYFLSVRPGDLQNDTLFLHEISNTIKSGKASLSLKVLKTDSKYGVPPEVPQPKGGDTLQTNDCRVLGGIFHNNKIQYVQTSVIKPQYRSGVFHGMFDVRNTSKIKSSFIWSDTSDYAYPSICYAGNGGLSDQSSVITFSYVSAKMFPGTSAVFHTQVSSLPSLFSNILYVKKGESIIERLTHSQSKSERWGDYTGIQQQYNKPKTIWLSGSFGNKSQLNGTWIGKLKVIGNIEIESENTLKVFPNPVSSKICIGINNQAERSIKITIYDTKGKLIKEIFNGNTQPGYNEYYFDISEFSNGLYILRVYDDTSSEVYTAKFIK